MKTQRERTSEKDPASVEADVLSYYRRYARDCGIAAKNAPNEKQRSALQKMLPAWNDFAELHERTIRKCGKAAARSARPIKGWM